MQKHLKRIQGYTVYQYTFLDDLSFIRSPAEYIAATSIFSLERLSADEIVAVVRHRFLAAGWEGDGEIGVLWLPPFVGVGVEDTWGTYVWHVKQGNNGISFLLSPVSLDFARLASQNEEFRPHRERGTPVSIVRGEADELQEAARRIADELTQSLASLVAVTDQAVATRVKDTLLAHNQGLLIRALNEFLDDCYLRFLIEAMNGNRAKLKLRKSRVQLSPPQELDEDLGDESQNWLTVQGVISDMWRAYKFEPYKSKVEMLFKSVDFELERQAVHFIAKHVLLRNCVQHHKGHLDGESLQQLGLVEVRVKSAAGDVVISRGKPILLFKEELADLSSSLIKLATEFDAHVWKRVSARDYVARV